MGSISKSLVVVTEDQDARPALSRAIKLAVENDAELTLLLVTERMPADPKALLPPAVLAEMEAALQRQREADLEALARVACESGVSARIAHREGTPFLAVIREVLRENYDLVLKTAGGTGEGERAFGGTDKHLLRKCPCPIWLIRPDAPECHRRVLAAVDPDGTNLEQKRLSAEVLRAAIEVARMDGATLDVLHAWYLFGESILRGTRTTVSDPEVYQFVGGALNRHGQYLDELVDGTPDSGVDLKRHLVRGRPGDVISSWIRSNDVDLLVMGTVGRTGIPGLLIGNTAERVIDEVHCSILALKPRGFVSPVTPEV